MASMAWHEPASAAETMTAWKMMRDQYDRGSRFKRLSRLSGITDVSLCWMVTHEPFAPFSREFCAQVAECGRAPRTIGAYVDIAEIAQRLRALFLAGWTYREMAETADLPTDYIYKVANGSIRRVSPERMKAMGKAARKLERRTVGSGRYIAV